MFIIKPLLYFAKLHKHEIKKLSHNNLRSFLIEDDPLPYDIASLSTNDSSTNSEESDNQTRDRKVPWLLFSIPRGGGGSSDEPANAIPSVSNILTPLTSYIFKMKGILKPILSGSDSVHGFINTILSGSESVHGFIDLIFTYIDQLLIYLTPHLSWIIPILLFREYHSYINKFSKIHFQFRVPSHRLYFSSFHLKNQNLNIKRFQDFLKPERGTRFMREFHTISRLYRNYARYSISTLNRLDFLKDQLGLVCVNSLNLVLDTVHNSYAGAGLKSLRSSLYSSILVQLVTKVSSPQRTSKRYGIFNILVIGGIGVVVWYKTSYIPYIPESTDYFQNPTAVVEGYKRLTFWMTQDVHEIVKHTFTHEAPFNEIDLEHREMEKSVKLVGDPAAYIGTSIILATFITTNVLIPLITANVVIPPTQG